MSVASELDTLYQNHSRRILATLIRLLGEFELAEEAMHEAFALALQQWAQDGVPANPTAWLISTGRFRAIDQIRRNQTARRYAPLLADQEEPEDEAAELDYDAPGIEDDRLRLIFTCCHPALATETQLAMTLREMCGLTTEQVARGLLQQPSTVAQRIVRAKRKIRDAGIPYEVPDAEALPARLNAVLQVIYLMFNEAYSSSQGDVIVNVDLAAEAIRLTRLLQALLQSMLQTFSQTEAPNPSQRADITGLLALLLLQDSRRAARQDDTGRLITLEEQDRQRWNHAQIAEGVQCLNRALTQGPAGIYTLQAAIAALHAQAASYQDTDWRQIVGLYDALYRLSPSPVIALNRAVAVAMCDGPEAGLQLVDELASAGRLQNYHLLHAARADFYRRMGNSAAARDAYEKALALTEQAPERAFLQARLAALTGIAKKV